MIQGRSYNTVMIKYITVCGDLYNQTFVVMHLKGPSIKGTSIVNHYLEERKKHAK